MHAVSEAKPELFSLSFGTPGQVWRFQTVRVGLVRLSRSNKIERQRTSLIEYFALESRSDLLPVPSTSSPVKFKGVAKWQVQALV